MLNIQYSVHFIHADLNIYIYIYPYVQRLQSKIYTNIDVPNLSSSIGSFDKFVAFLPTIFVNSYLRNLQLSITIIGTPSIYHLSTMHRQWISAIRLKLCALWVQKFRKVHFDITVIINFFSDLTVYHPPEPILIYCSKVRWL